MELVNLCLIGILGVAVIIDCLTYKIPNALILGALAAGFVIKGTNALLSGDPWIILKIFAGMLITFLLLFPLYALRALGAGDIKLIIVVSVYMTLKEALYICLLSLFIGAIIGIISLIVSLLKIVSKGLSYKELFVFHRIHYSIPIFLATLQAVGLIPFCH